MHVTKKMLVFPAADGEEERKPFDRSKVHPSSSMTEAHDLDAAGSIQRPNTPVENVYVVTKEAKVKYYVIFKLQLLLKS